jgi:hypothetical protein
MSSGGLRREGQRQEPEKVPVLGKTIILTGIEGRFA